MMDQAFALLSFSKDAHSIAYGAVILSLNTLILNCFSSLSAVLDAGHASKYAQTMPIY